MTKSKEGKTTFNGPEYIWSEISIQKIWRHLQSKKSCSLTRQSFSQCSSNRSIATYLCKWARGEFLKRSYGWIIPRDFFFEPLPVSSTSTFSLTFCWFYRFLRFLLSFHPFFFFSCLPLSFYFFNSYSSALIIREQRRELPPKKTLVIKQSLWERFTEIWRADKYFVDALLPVVSQRSESIDLITNSCSFLFPGISNKLRIGIYIGA